MLLDVSAFGCELVGRDVQRAANLFSMCQRVSGLLEPAQQQWIEMSAVRL